MHAWDKAIVLLLVALIRRGLGDDLAFTFEEAADDREHKFIPPAVRLEFDRWRQRTGRKDPPEFELGAAQDVAEVESGLSELGV